MTSPSLDVYDDLITEGEALDELVSGLSMAQWSLPTPAPGWTIAHQIAHITSTARVARAAASDPAAFQSLTRGATDDWDALLEAALRPYLAQPPGVLLATWREQRAAATRALMELPPSRLVPWIGRQVPAGMLAGLGHMELFAHGQDIADALSASIPRTDRVRHLVAVGVNNWRFGYLARGLAPPVEPFRFEVTAPSGSVWAYGPSDAAQRVTGPAVDFCLLVTRRRHRADLRLEASGADAEAWLDIAQAYRGGPGEGRRPGQFADAPADASAVGLSRG